MRSAAQRESQEQVAYAISEPVSRAPLPHQRLSVGGQRNQAPRHPNGLKNKQMIAGYRPHYKEGFQQQRVASGQNRGRPEAPPADSKPYQ